MKRKGALCLLALLLLFAGSIFTRSQSRPGSPAAEALHSRPAHSLLSARSLTLPMMAENASRLLESSHPTQPQATFLPNRLPMHHLIGAGSSQSLFRLSHHGQLSTNASLLPVIARSLGFSSLVLRE